MEKRKYSYLMPIWFSLVLITGVLTGIFITHRNGNLLLQGSSAGKLNEVIRYVEQNYVDTISRMALEEKSITGMLQKLDPHSGYIPASEFAQVNDPLLGSFEGIGVQFRIENDTITVITPIAGGPSEKVGIKAGDRIVRIDGEPVSGKKLTNNDVMRKLKGPKGTEVEVMIFRRGEPDLLSFTIIRDVIPTYSLDIAYMVSPGIGYIRLNNFSATTTEEFHEALGNLLSSGMEKLIVDLQGNTGGYLEAAVDVANEFLKKDQLIVYTEGMHHPKEVYTADGKGLFKTGEVVILIDEWSASAAEILAGAIQDNDRGTIVGRRSFGKGLVQGQLHFKDGSAVRLTVAKYFTPTGRCIQRPYDQGNDEYNTEYYHRVMNGELEHSDSIRIADSLKFMTPGGKVVYGGGGIIPDVFVPLERNDQFKYYSSLLNKGLIYKYAFDYTDRHRKELEKLTTYEEFDRSFQVSGEMFEEMIRFAETKGAPRDQDDHTLSDARVKTMIKAYIGRNILDNEAFFPFVNSIDPVFLKGIEVIGKK
jgi:carboxyl-terminal processing protease